LTHQRTNQQINSPTSKAIDQPTKQLTKQLTNRPSIDIPESNQLTSRQAIDQAIDANNEQKGAMKQTAEAILKLCGNKSILINKMTPQNFLSVWDVLKPLMKNNGNIPDINEKQEELLKLVVLKDNIGEATWYVYTAVLLISMVTYYLATTSCSKSVDQLKASHEEYLKQEQARAASKKVNNSTTFVVTN
jgi:hypothetical protein